MLWKNKQQIWILIIPLLVLLTFFPSFRAIIIGHGHAVSMFDMLISALPEIFIFTVCTITFFNTHKTTSFRWETTDKIVLFTFLYAVIIGSLVSRDFKLIILGMRQTYIPMLIYFAVRRGNWEQVQIKSFIHFLMLWLSFWSFTGLLFYFLFPETEHSIMTAVGAHQGEYFIPRLNSIYYSPTVNGLFSCIASTYYCIRFLEDRKWWIPLLLLVNTASLLLSVSRGGIIGFLVVFVILIFVHRKKFTLLIQLVSVIVFSFLITLTSVKMNSNEFGWIFSSTGETVSLSENVSRVQLWKDTWRDLKENPMGYGLGKSGWIAHEHLKNSDIKSAYNATDGWYLKTANELGILGILLFLIFFIWAVMRFHQLAFDKDHSILFMIFLLASIINGVSNVLDYFLFNVIFWITIGLMEQLKIDEHAKK